MNARRLAIGLFGLTVVLLVAAAALAATVPSSEPWWFLAGVFAVAIVYVGTGSVLGARLPRNPIGWILIVIGFFQALNAFTSGFTELARHRDGGLPLDDVVGWVGAWSWVPSVGSLVTFLVLLFPDGRPPSSRWRIVGWVAGTGIAAAVLGAMIGFWPVRHPALVDPDGVEPVGVGSGLLIAGFIVTGIAAIASIASLVVRFRRSAGEERQQLRWFTLAAAVVVLGTFLSFTPLDASYGVLIVGFFLVPMATAVAILKYRLYELDVVINKAVLFGTLAAFATVVYVAIVVGVGALVGSAGNAVLSAVAAAVVALAFQPVRARARRLADRVVYGRRATPYEVLAEFSDRVGGSYGVEEVLTRMALVLGEGTGAAQATVWLRLGADLRPAAVWPSGSEPNVQPPADAVEVRHRGEVLGALSVRMPASDPMTPAKARLVADLAAQAGLVLRNVRLIEEVRESRRRIVATQDARAKKLERDIHDGAQQQLVALVVKQRLVESLVGRDDEGARAMLRELQAETTEALENLRDLARGIYPPLLADRGLTAALEAQSRKSPVPTRIESDGIGRHPQEVESAVYFSVLEAMQNVAKYAEADRVVVRLGDSSDEMWFEVADDGRGFDPVTTSYGTGLQGIADRLAALGGVLEVRSTRGEGTVLTGRVPLGRSR